MRFYTKKRRMPAINIVSLIDILTILLIFFIVTTTFKKEQPQVVIQLPESKTSASAPAEIEPALITITGDEKIYLDKDPIGIEELGVRVREIQMTAPNRQIALNADKKASFGFIIGVLDSLKEAGVKNLPAFTQSPNES